MAKLRAKKTVRGIAIGLGSSLAAAVTSLGVLYYTRFRTIASIKKLTDHRDYNLYRMNVKYHYDIDKIIKRGIVDDQTLIDAIVVESMPYLPVHIQAPNFACSAFCATDTAGEVLMGRNYDFKNDTSAMLVYCTPEKGYKSVAMGALDNICANSPDSGLNQKITCLTAPFLCLDGMNEKGVSIAVLTLDSEPTYQKTGRPVIGTALAIRLILDRAAMIEEAVKLFESYDMFASSGRDYHFYVTDASGDSRIIEYDCAGSDRKLVATPVRTATNFFEIHKDHVLLNQKNGIYGHGRERYDKIEGILSANEGSVTKDIAWEALKAAAQDPNPEDVTSNTQWSVVYDDTNLTAQIAVRRNWGEVYDYSLRDNVIS